METGEKKIIIEENPQLPVYIYDGEDRLTFLYKRMPINKCRIVQVPYATKGKSIANELGLGELYSKLSKEGKWAGAIERELIKKSKHIFGLTVDLRDVRKKDFYNKYPENRKLKSFNKVVSDIEADVLQYKLRGMAIPKNPMDTIDNPIVPINMITTYHYTINRAIHWILCYDNCGTTKMLLDISPDDYSKLVKDKMIKHMEFDHSNKNSEKIEKLIHEIDIDTRIFTDEAELIADFFYHNNIEADADVCLFWNAAYDIQYLVARYNLLTGGAAARDFCHPDIPLEFRDIQVRDSCCDKNYETGEITRKYVDPKDRHDSFYITGKTVYLDSLSTYVSLRATVPNKPPNMRLDTVLQHEVGVGKLNLAKLNYTVINVHHHDLPLASAYNIGDVVPLGYMEYINGDVDKAVSFTESCRIENVTSVVASTTGNLSKSLAETDQVLGPNINIDPFEALSEGRKVKKIVSEVVDGAIVSKEVLVKLEEEQKEFYVGGLVADTSKNRLLSRELSDYDRLYEEHSYDGDLEYDFTEFTKLAKLPEFINSLSWIHKVDPDREQENSLDYDMKSEYPTIMCAFDIGEMTLIFRLRRVGTDWECLSATQRYNNIRNIVEAYTSRDRLTMMNEFFNFPTIKSILNRYMKEVLMND